MENGNHLIKKILKRKCKQKEILIMLQLKKLSKTTIKLVKKH
jgi:ribosomal protein L30/L7E